MIINRFNCEFTLLISITVDSTDLLPVNHLTVNIIEIHQSDANGEWLRCHLGFNCASCFVGKTNIDNGVPTFAYWPTRRKHLEATADLFVSLSAGQIPGFDALSDPDEKQRQLRFKFRMLSTAQQAERLTQLDDQLFKIIAEELQARVLCAKSAKFDLRQMLIKLCHDTPADEDHFFQSAMPGGAGQDDKTKIKSAEAASCRNCEVRFVASQLCAYVNVKGGNLTDNIVKRRRCPQVSQLRAELTELCSQFTVATVETATSTTIGNEPQLPSSIAPPAHPMASSSIVESASEAFTPPSLEDPIGVDPAKGQLPEKEQYGVVRDQADLLIQQLGNGTSGFLK